MMSARLLLGSVLLLPALGWAITLPESLGKERLNLKLVGTSELRWFGFSVYDVSLWTGTGRFQCCSEPHPVAIAFQYKRRISRDRLVESTVEEWKRIGILDSATRQRWKSRIGSIWRDVDDGDTLVALVLPAEGTQFYDRDRFLGAITNPEFGPALLSIWFNPRSRLSKLGEAMLERES